MSLSDMLRIKHEQTRNPHKVALNVIDVSELPLRIVPLMQTDARPADVARSGIRGITVEQLREASAAGCVIRLLARGEPTASGVRLRVAPEMLPLASPLGAARGASNAVTLKTDLMGELTVTETDPGVRQTAYALLSDLLRIHQEIHRR